MKRISSIAFVHFLIFLIIFQPVETISGKSQVTINQQAKLTIYTYDSLFADPQYDFITAFESYAQLPVGSLEVVRLGDAGDILTRANSEKENPVADVLIGIDNVLVHKARELDILTAYQPVNSSNLLPGLVDGLAGDYLLTPYDFGIISLWYRNDILTTIDPSTFVLNDLITKDLASKTIVENPTTSSPGLGFLLWTIAVFGDPENNIKGLLDSDWKEFWNGAANDFRIVDSWGDAISLLYTDEENRPMMVSYSSSPSYGSCQFDDYTTTALLSNEGGKQWGWQQIEGVGLVKNGPNPALAKQFIDWFISNEVQSEVLQSQWVYPVIPDIQVPECYNASIQPDQVEPLNSILSQDEIKTYLDTWLDEWEVAIVNQADKNIIPIPFTPSLIIFGILVILLRKKDVIVSN